MKFSKSSNIECVLNVSIFMEQVSIKQKTNLRYFMQPSRSLAVLALNVFIEAVARSHEAVPVLYLLVRLFSARLRLGKGRNAFPAKLSMVHVF